MTVEITTISDDRSTRTSVTRDVGSIRYPLQCLNDKLLLLQELLTPLLTSTCSQQVVLQTGRFFKADFAIVNHKIPTHFRNHNVVPNPDHIPHFYAARKTCPLRKPHGLGMAMLYQHRPLAPSKNCRTGILESKCGPER